jgi:hypothetical protein
MVIALRVVILSRIDWPESRLRLKYELPTLRLMHVCEVRTHKHHGLADLVTTCFFLLVTRAWPQEPAKTPQAQPQKKTEMLLQLQESPTHDSLLSPPFATGSPLAPETPPQNTQPKIIAAKEEGTEFWPAIWGYKLKVSDTMLVAATFLLFIATLGLWVATRHLVRDAERISERQLRAYIDGRASNISPFSTAIPIRMTFRMTNHGRTPAYNVSHASAITVLPHPLPPNFQFAAPVPAPSHFTLHPGVHFDAGIVAPNTLTAHEINAVTTANGAMRIYLYGTIGYADFLNRRRETKFCLSVLPGQNLAAISQGQAPAQPVAIDFGACEQHNEAT